MFSKIKRVIFSRTFAFVIVILLQIGLFCALMWWLAGLGALTYVLLTIITVLVLVFVLEQDDLNPAYKLMWMLIIVVLPVFGMFFYLAWGHRTVPRRKRRLLAEIEARYSGVLAQDEAVLAALAAQDIRLGQSARYLERHAASPVYRAGRCEYYPIGQDFFPRFLEEIAKAEKYIFMEYYIWEEGEMLGKTLDVLRQKVREGVDVRILIDGIGSLLTLPPGFDKKLRADGIKCHIFEPIKVTLHISDYAMLNHRDHRKITVIDGKVGFSGGLNFADEYINVKERFGEWKDNSFMITGEAVFSLATTFLHGWDFASDSVSDPALYRATLPAPTQPPTLRHGYVQPYWDSPLDAENVSENAYLNIIRHAREYVWISTPYLILDHEMITSLTLAAKSGVDVRIITPAIPDKPTVFLVTQSYYPVLLAGGVRIYEYTPGFIHAKTYVSDDCTAVVGSANMDYRSLYLHFENCVAFYGGSVVPDAKRDMETCFARSREIMLEDTRNMKLPRRILQIVARFFSPML